MAPVRPRRILVIGGGPVGLVTLRNLIQRGNFERVELVERRDDVGGVWYLEEQEDTGPQPRWPSPAYPGLVGNVLPEFLSFSGSPFPEPPDTPHQPFPTLKETYSYLRNFAEPYLEQGNIRLNTEVSLVEELAEGKGWNVTMRDWTANGETVSEIWDGVVMCTGWYDDPVWPETEGIERLKKAGLAKHAKWYRGPENYAGKRVLIIGNGNSANDIASHLAPLARNPVYRSIRRPALPHFVSLPDSRILDVAPVNRFAVEGNDKVTAELTDGTIIEDLDVVFICSGYFPNPSFLHVRSPDAPSTASAPLMSQVNPLSPQSRRIPSLHKYILYAYNPTLAFIGSIICYTPFTIADVSSTWLTLAWTNEISYPSTSEGRLQFEKELIENIERQRKIQAQKTGREPSSLFAYTALGAGEEDYAADLKCDIIIARPELKDVLPEWNEERREWRQAMHPVKYQSLLWTKKQMEAVAQPEP